MKKKEKKENNARKKSLLQLVNLSPDCVSKRANERRVNHHQQQGQKNEWEKKGPLVTVSASRDHNGCGVKADEALSSEGENETLLPPLLTFVDTQRFGGNFLFRFSRAVVASRLHTKT